MRKLGCKTCLIVGILLMIGVVGLAVVALPVLMPSELHQDLTFDQQVWKANKNWDMDNPRGRMLDSLLAGNRLRGLTRAEVIALLGPPDGLDNHVPDDLAVSEEAILTSEGLDYVVGTSFLDYLFLSICFDSHGRVRRWSVWQS
jgi:hypothetical protein